MFTHYQNRMVTKDIQLSIHIPHAYYENVVKLKVKCKKHLN